MGSRNSKEADLLTRDAAGVWKWKSIAPMLAGHSRPGITKLNGRILVAGGRCSDVELLTMYADDPHDLGQWTLLSSLSRVYEDPQLHHFQGKYYSSVNFITVLNHPGDGFWSLNDLYCRQQTVR